MGQTVILIAAVSENGVIGSGGKLPWNLAGDRRMFRETTLGKPLILGRKTYEGIKGYLGEHRRLGLVAVVTREAGYDAGADKRAGSLREALALFPGAPEIFVGGGGEIYREAMPLADRLYITRVRLHCEGDARFPEIDQSLWAETARREWKGSGGEPDCDFVAYGRRAPKA